MLAVGLNHKTAPIEIREKTAFTADSTLLALQELTGSSAVNEAVILSTCNRTEVYCDCTNSDYIVDWMAEFHHMAPDQLNNYWYTHHGQDAVDHIMRVACGLDSMMVGEPQILGQMKNAFSIAQQVGSIGDAFSRLFPTVFSVTKQVRNDTAIGASPVSIAYAAVNLAKQIFSDLSRQTVLLIGAGETIELAAMHFFNQNVQRIIVANRSVEKAKELAEEYHGHWIGLADLPIYLKESDIVVAATASQLPLLGKGAVESAIKVRKHRPIFMADLAVPRDIEPEVAELEDVYLYNIDDLKGIVAKNKKCREEAADLANEMIKIHAAHFMREMQALNSLHTLRSYRDKIEAYKAEELADALRKLHRGRNPEEVVVELARNLTNKIMHNPSTELRQAAFDGRKDLLAFAKKLFQLESS